MRELNHELPYTSSNSAGPDALAGESHARFTMGIAMTTQILNKKTKLAKVLGFAGLVPFIGLAYLVNTFGAHEDFLRHALLAYGACIVSFVGAVHWGIWLSSSANQTGSSTGLAWSVVPSVAAWIALTIDTRASMAVMAALLVLCLLVDIALRRTDSLPPWYLTMRVTLTLFGSGSLLAGML